MTKPLTTPPSPGPSVTTSGTRPGAWDGYYINLDRSPERRRHMEQQLATLGVADRYRRFPAIDGRKLSASPRLSAGEVAIYQSHLEVIGKAAAAGRAVHVMEDDVALCDLTVPAIDLAIRSRAIDHYDILFLDFMPKETMPTIRSLHALYQATTDNGATAIVSPDQLRIIDIDDLYQWSTTSYVIGAKNVGRVHALLSERWRQGPVLPFDREIEAAAHHRRLRLGSFFPFVSATHFDLARVSTAGRSNESDTQFVQRILKYAFFVRRDIRGVAAPAMAEVIERNSEPDPDGFMDLYASIIRFRMAKPIQQGRRSRRQP